MMSSNFFSLTTLCSPRIRSDTTFIIRGEYEPDRSVSNAFRVTLGHLKDGEGHFRVTVGHYRITIGQLVTFLSLSEHKANTK